MSSHFIRYQDKCETTNIYTHRTTNTENYTTDLGRRCPAVLVPPSESLYSAKKPKQRGHDQIVQDSFFHRCCLPKLSNSKTHTPPLTLPVILPVPTTSHPPRQATHPRAFAVSPSTAFSLLYDPPPSTSDTASWHLSLSLSLSLSSCSTRERSCTHSASSACQHECVCMNIYVYIYIYMYTVYTCMCVLIHILCFLSVCVCVCVSLPPVTAIVHACLCVYEYIYMYIYCVYMYVCL